MTSRAKLSYQRLKHELRFEEEEEGDCDIRQKVIGRLKNSRFRRVNVRRKLKVKIPCANRFFERKTKLIKLAWNKVWKRLKESRSHFGDLFSGNYLFMQVAPTPLKYRAENGKYVVKGQDYLHGLYSRYITQKS